MQVIVPSKSIPIDHPIRQMARFVDANEWRLQHSTETEISVEIPGNWSDYCLTFTMARQSATTPTAICRCAAPAALPLSRLKTSLISRWVSVSVPTRPCFKSQPV